MCSNFRFIFYREVACIAIRSTILCGKLADRDLLLLNINDKYETWSMLIIHWVGVGGNNGPHLRARHNGKQD